MTHRYRELVVYYFGDDGKVEMDKYNDVTYGRDMNGWLVVNLGDDKGVFRYPDSSIVKIRESA